MSTRRWCKALSGLWERNDPAARVIVHDALEAAEQVATMVQGAHWRSLLEAIESAKRTGEEAEIMAFDEGGRPVILSVCLSGEGADRRLFICTRNARYRLYQMVGEPA